MAIMSKRKVDAERFKSKVKEFWEIMDHRPIKWFLGFQIKRQEIKDYFNKSVSIHQFNSGKVQTHKCKASLNPHRSKCSVLDTAESLILEASRTHERSTVL